MEMEVALEVQRLSLKELCGIKLKGAGGGADLLGTVDDV
jgi:hypothetical protein